MSTPEFKALLEMYEDEDEDVKQSYDGTRPFVNKSSPERDYELKKAGPLPSANEMIKMLKQQHKEMYSNVDFSKAEFPLNDYIPWLRELKMQHLVEFKKSSMGTVTFTNPNASPTPIPIQYALSCPTTLEQHIFSRKQIDYLGIMYGQFFEMTGVSRGFVLQGKLYPATYGGRILGTMRLENKVHHLVLYFANAEDMRAAYD